MPVLLVLLLVLVYSQIDEDNVRTQQFLLDREEESGTVHLHYYNNYVLPFAFTPYRLKAMNSKLALVAGTDQVSNDDIHDFEQEMDLRYPGISFTAKDIFPPGTPLPEGVPEVVEVPKFSEVVEVYSSQKDLENFIGSSSYASSPGDTTVRD